MGRKRESGAFQNTHLQLYNIYWQKWLHFDNCELTFCEEQLTKMSSSQGQIHTQKLNYNRVQSSIYIQHIIFQPFQQGYCKRVYAKLTDTFIYDITHKFYGIIL